MRRIALAAVVTAWCAPVAAAPVDGVAVLVSRNAPDALDVSYTLPPDCTRLAFLKDERGADRIRARWQSLDGAVATGDTLIRTLTMPRVVRFRVPVTSDKVTGYPGSFPIGTAIYAHMSNYAVSDACGPVRYRFAGTGSIETAGARLDRDAATDADSPALLFPDRRTGSDSLDYLDPAISPAAAAQIEHVAEGTASFLRRAMPKANFKRPILAATVASAPGGPTIGGSAGDILLLTLFNWPAAPGADLQRQMNKLVAHEMSHRFQMRDAVDIFPDARLIHEGGAEFLRWAVSLRQGWLTPEQAGAELDDALATCMLAAGDRAWHDVPASEIASNRLEYSCGLPAYVYALAARTGHATPFARIDDFYAALRAGGRPDFAAAIECGRAPCTSRVLSPLLSGTTPLRSQWSAILDATALARRRPPSQSQTDAMTLQALTALVKQDCGGASSITPTPNAVLIDTLDKCHTVRADIVVERIEGTPVFANRDALPAMVAACAARHAVTLGLAGGGTLAMPCATPYRPAPHFYAADMRKIARLLE